MSLDLSPAPGVAPARRRILAHARTELTVLLRNGEQLLLALVIPIGVLIAGSVLAWRWGVSMGTLAPSVIALALWSTGFTSLAIATGFERRYGVLERLAATPIGTAGVVAGKALATLAIAAGQAVLLGGLALALGWRPHPTLASWVVAVPTALLAVVAFAALALVLAGRLRAEVVLGLANLVYLVLLMVGGIMWPLASFPAVVRPIIGALPTAALGEALRGWSIGTAPWWTLGVAAAWALGSVLLARKLMRWIS